MSVIDNVKVGLHNQIKYGMWTGILRLPAFKEKEHEMNREAMKLLKIFDLDKEANYKASQLPYGKQRKLEIARALATNPKLLLLDEPAAGMNPNETEELMHTIHSVRDQFGVAILLLLHTLCVYLLQEQNLHATARQLFIHRNTLVYRLQRIRTLLQLDLDDAAVRNVLRTGCILLEYYQGAF